jgi:hypothetical protein
VPSPHLAPPLTLTDLSTRLTERVAAGAAETELLAPGSEWNLSQTIQHCAQTVRYSVVGYPALRPALFRATAGAVAKRLFLRRGAMRHPLGAEIEGAPPLVADLPVPAAVEQLAKAVSLFSGHTGTHAPHPAYGVCTHDEFARLHAMHIVEHLPGLTT